MAFTPASTYIGRIACLRAVEGSTSPEALLDSEQSRLLARHPGPGVMWVPRPLRVRSYVRVNVPFKWGNPDPDSPKDEDVPLVVPTRLRFWNVGI